MAADLREIHGAATVDQAAAKLEAFEGEWAGKYPSIAPAWRRAWHEVISFFAFDPAIRKVIYTGGRDREPEPPDPQIHRNARLVPDRG